MHTQKTVLEQALEADWRYQWIRAASAKSEEIQRGLDRIGPEICAKLSAKEILAHTNAVYTDDDVIDNYRKLPDHREIVDPLITFMNLRQLSEGSRVLDLGCGPLMRDALYMGCAEPKFRTQLMGRMKDGKPMRERLPIPTRAFCVSVADQSREVLLSAYAELLCTEFAWQEHGWKYLRLKNIFQPMDMHDLSSISTPFDGVWACTSLFTHTPRSLVRPALESIAHVLTHKGVLGVSYPAGRDDAPYDRLLYSGTGRIKYFSHPTPGFIAREAEAAGFYLMTEEWGDLTRHGELKKNFFVTQFFQKAT